MPAPLPKFEPDEPAAGPFLFPSEYMQEITDQEQKHGKYTLARLPEEKRKCIVQLLIERRSHRDIERMLHVHQETIRAVADAHAVEIDAAWQHFGKKLRRINWALADRLEKEAPNFPVQSIPLAIKLVGEHAELIEGRATERIEEVQRVDIYAHWRRFMSGQEIGLGGEKIPVIEGELVTDQASAPAALDSAGNLATGMQSDDLTQPSQGNGSAIPGFSYGLTAENHEKSSQIDAPPGAGSRVERPGQPWTGNGSQKFLANEE
jgi:hypothetical protein